MWQRTNRRKGLTLVEDDALLNAAEDPRLVASDDPRGEELDPLDDLSPVQRRVFLRRACGHTFEEIGDMEREDQEAAGTGADEKNFAPSKSSAHRVYLAAVELLKRKRKTRASVSPLLAAFFGVRLDEPPAIPPEMHDRIVRNVCEQLGLEHSGARRRDSDPPFSPRTGSPRLLPRPVAHLPTALVGSIVGAFVGVACFIACWLLFFGATFPRCDQDPHGVQSTSPPGVSPVTSSVAAALPTPDPVEAAEIPPAVAAPLPAPPPRTTEGRDDLGEQRLLDAAQAALARGNGADALTALADLARQYPSSGSHAELRARLRMQACAMPKTHCARSL